MVLAQAFDVARQPNQFTGGINCVLSDRVHSIGAVLTADAMHRWQQSMPTYETSRLNFAVLLIERYEILLNENTGQFTLHVLQFAWLVAADAIGQPKCIMTDAAIRALFEATLAARANAMHQLQPPQQQASPPPVAPRPAESYCRRLQRSYPMARACFPIEAHAPHSVLPHFLTIPAEQQVPLALTACQYKCHTLGRSRARFPPNRPCTHRHAHTATPLHSHAHPHILPRTRRQAPPSPSPIAAGARSDAARTAVRARLLR